MEGISASEVQDFRENRCYGLLLEALQELESSSIQDLAAHRDAIDMYREQGTIAALIKVREFLEHELEYEAENAGIPEGEDND